MSAAAQVTDTSQPGGVTSPFVVLLRIELGRAFGPRHAVALAGMVLMGYVLAFWLPTFPTSIYRFFQRVFNLPGWSEIVVANDLAGLFFFAYWIAVFDVLTIYIVPAGGAASRRLSLETADPTRLHAGPARSHPADRRRYLHPVRHRALAGIVDGRSYIRARRLHRCRRRGAGLDAASRQYRQLLPS